MIKETAFLFACSNSELGKEETAKFCIAFSCMLSLHRKDLQDLFCGMEMYSIAQL